jgi:circadian clock protein KaiB
MTNNDPDLKIDDNAQESGEGPNYVLRLYVSGSSPKSLNAIINIKRICEKYLRNQVDLEVVDIYQNPDIAKEAQIIAAPTLIKTLPEPLRRAIGDLSDEEKVLFALDIKPS